MVSGYRLYVFASIKDSQSFWKSEAEEEVRMAAPNSPYSSIAYLLKGGSTIL